MKTIDTHIRPDMDAAAATWLARRFIADLPVSFHAASDPRPDDAAIICDRGGVYSPATLAFDHHHLPGKEASNTSATQSDR